MEGDWLAGRDASMSYGFRPPRPHPQGLTQVHPGLGGRAVSEGNSWVGNGEPCEGKYTEDPVKQTSGEFAHTGKKSSDSALLPNNHPWSFRRLDCCFAYQS